MQKLPLLFTKVNQVVKIVQNSFFFLFLQGLQIQLVFYIYVQLLRQHLFFVGGGGGNLFLFREVSEVGEGL